ncbi:perforin-1-like [Carcharodon carcharias]|uniref:perforin-1-like n=1 Tax=Carcharodon carcharias TaxID=13397 RepID=UPI001B7D9E90|nr:perforin-1-like [Carcharodon carcharias]
MVRILATSGSEPTLLEGWAAGLGVRHQLRTQVSTPFGKHTWTEISPTLMTGAATDAMMPNRRPAILLLLLCLCFRDSLCDCNTGNANECQGTSFVPGARLAGEGYDVVTLQTKGAFVIDVNSRCNPDGTCTLCSNWLMSDARQRLPLSLVDWRVRPSCKRLLSSRLFRSAAELGISASSKISNDWKADLQVTPKPGVTANFVVAGSKSKLTTFGTTRSKSDKYSFTSHEFHCQYYQYWVKDQPLLAAQFAQSLAILPNASHEGTRYHYRKLVATYGTHYIKSVALGGLFKDLTAIRTCEVASQGYTSEEVKDCLGVEASIQVGILVRGTARYERCKELARAMGHGDSFHQAFSDRETEDGTAFTRWADSLTASPGMVRYALEPLHHLLPRSDPRHANLQHYISDYITANALSRECDGGTQCPSGSHRDRRDPCSCLCHQDSLLDRQCCPKVKGMGRLSVTVKRGRDLWGDDNSATDGYVIVQYGQVSTRTLVVSHTNNPTWNTKLDLGVVKAESGLKLTLEVWDQDYGYDDDLLGTCKMTLTSGAHDEVCYLSYGSLTYGFTFTCAPHLGGHTCQGYLPSPNRPAFTPYLGAPQTPTARGPPGSKEPPPSVVFP